MRDGDLVVLDDPSLERALIDTRKVSSSDAALQLASAATSWARARELLTVVQRAIDALRETAAFAPPMIGPHAWDALAREAGGADLLVELVRAARRTLRTSCRPRQTAAPLTVEDIERAPDAVLARLVRAAEV